MIKDVKIIISDCVVGVEHINVGLGFVSCLFPVETGSCGGTNHDVIIFGHHVINFDHKIYYKADHRRIQCHGDVLSSLGSRNTNGWIIQASNHLQKAWDIILSWILSDFWLAGLGFHLSEPQKSKFHNSGDEKHKVEHLSFLKHPKLLPNSS